MLSGIGAWKAYRLAAKHDAVLSSDEQVVAGRLRKPDLAHIDHSKCVLWTHLVNRSQRRAVVNDVRAFEPDGKPIDVTWSGRISSVGNPEAASGLLPIELSTELYLRRDDGEAFRQDTTVKIAHTFKGSPLVLKFSSNFDWIEWATS
jgi:hypothetical protein